MGKLLLIATITLTSLSAYAQQLTTVVPGTPGVSTYTVTFQSDSTHNLTPVFTPVSQNSAGTYAGAYVVGFDDSPVFIANGCLKGCLGTPQTFTVFDVSFASPVKQVDVSMGAQFDNVALLEAFNSSGQMVGSCAGAADAVPANNVSIPAGCFKWSPGQTSGTFVISDSSANISTVLAAGIYTTVEDVTKVQFVPEPSTLGLLGLGLAGLVFAHRRRRQLAKST